MQSVTRRRAFLAIHAACLLALLPLAVLGNPAQALGLLLLPVGWLALRWAGEPPALRSPLSLPLFVVALGLLISLYATPDMAWSYPKIAGLLFGVALYLAFLRWGTSERAWRRLALAFSVAGGVVAAAALFGTAWPSKIPALAGIIARIPKLAQAMPGVDDAGFHPNEVAGTLLWTMPLAWCLALALWQEVGRTSAGRRSRESLAAGAFTLIAAVLPLGVFILTQSRGGLFGLVAAGCVISLAALPRRFRILGAACMFAAVLGAAYLWRDVLIGGVAPTGAANLLSTGTLEFRLAVWSQALKGITDFPITGMGMNMFRRAVYVLYPTPLLDPAMNLGHAHNIFLQTALDLGLIGLVGYVALWFSSLAMLWASVKPGEALTGLRFFRLARIGLAASLLGYLVYGLLDTVALGARPAFLWWALLGLIASLYRGPALQAAHRAPMPAALTERPLARPAEAHHILRQSGLLP